MFVHVLRGEIFGVAGVFGLSVDGGDTLNGVFVPEEYRVFGGLGCVLFGNKFEMNDDHGDA